MKRFKCFILTAMIMCMFGTSLVSAEDYTEINFGYKKVDSDGDGTYDYIEIEYDETYTMVDSIIIPEEIEELPVTSIAAGTFIDCNNLKNIGIPDSVTSIGKYAFWGCSNLESIEIPENVKSIEELTFMGCSGLESITIYNPECEIYDSKNTIYSKTVIYGYIDLTAQTYAETYSREFVALDAESVVTTTEEITDITTTSEETTTTVSMTEITEDTTTIVTTTETTDTTTISEEITTEESRIETQPTETSTDTNGVEESEVIAGDANGDGVLRANDAAFIAKTIAQADISGEEISVEDYPAMDYNRDGRITAKDCAEIAYFLAQQSIQEHTTAFNENKTTTTTTTTTVIQVSETIVIYGLPSWAEEYIEIPEDKPTSYQLNITNASDASYEVIDGDSVEVSENGLITGKSKVETLTIIDRSGNISTSKKVTIAFGDSVIRVKTKSYIYEVNVSFSNYAEIYAEEVISNYISENITDDMTDYEKLVQACKFVASYNYDSSYSSSAGMIVSGGGDCWASTSTLIEICDQLGIKAWSRNANMDSGAGSGHMNAMAKTSDGKYYQLEAGYNEKAPRYYYVKERTELFDYEYNDDKSGIIIYQYDGDENVLVIPSEINGVPVIGIREIGFRSYNSSNFTSVSIPDTVEYIDGAFYGCSSLESIEIPDSVTSIGGGTFNGCSSLESIKIPDGVTSIGYNTFYGCSSLTSIEIPDSVTSIGEWAFSHCTSLESVKIGNGVTSIEKGAFYGCASLTSVVIPNSVVSIKSAFLYCTSLESVKIGNGVTSIVGGFGDCSSLTSVEIPESVTSIGYDTFYGCSGLERITIYNPECEIYDSKGTISDTAIIYGYKNSTAQAYAEKYGRKFSVIE